MQRLLRFLNLQNVFNRRQSKDGFEIRRNFVVESDRYPEYYVQNFHYQTDGWFSVESSKLYDFQVESLFLGAADAMRRHGLQFLSDYVTERGTSELSLLDVASGNGRFLSFVKDSYPSMDTTALELSPFYLSEARKLVWCSVVGKERRRRKRLTLIRRARCILFS